MGSRGVPQCLNDEPLGHFSLLSGPQALLCQAVLSGCGPAVRLTGARWSGLRLRATVGVANGRVLQGSTQRPARRSECGGLFHAPTSGMTFAIL
jgi:hypothetical protein